MNLNRPRTPVTRYRDHTVIGTPTELGNLLANHTAAGTLIASTAPRLTPDGTCRIVLRLRDTTPTRPASAARPNRRTSRIVALAVTTAGAIAGALTVVAYLLGQLVEFITPHATTIFGVLLVLGVIAALSARTSNRRHCPGC